jgi:hypothetical protein
VIFAAALILAAPIVDNPDIIRHGGADDSWIVQAFASHRIEAQRPLEKALHILQHCPDKQKKAEALIATAIKQAKGE